MDQSELNVDEESLLETNPLQLYKVIQDNNNQFKTTNNLRNEPKPINKEKAINEEDIIDDDSYESESNAFDIINKFKNDHTSHKVDENKETTVPSSTGKAIKRFTLNKPKQHYSSPKATSEQKTSREILEEKELKECTFKPNLSPGSRCIKTGKKSSPFALYDDAKRRMECDYNINRLVI